MKNAFFSSILAPCVALLLSAGALGGCATVVETNAEIDKGVHAPKRAMDMAKAIETDSNIGQINSALSMIKSDSEGKAPATIEEAKKAAKVPDSMWIDSDTQLPLQYDPVSGTVFRVGAVPNSAPHAGAKGAPGRINIPGGGGY